MNRKDEKMNLKFEINGDSIKVNGEEYIPKRTMDEIMAKVMAVVQSYPQGAVETIVVKQQDLNNESKSKRKKYPRRDDVISFNEREANPFHISRVDKKGNIYHIKNKNWGIEGKYKWDIDAVYYVRNHEFDGMTYRDSINIAKHLNLDGRLVRQIIWNLREGIFTPWFEEYEKQLYSVPVTKIQNNPQKRREGGYYG